MRRWRNRRSCRPDWLQGRSLKRQSPSGRKLHQSARLKCRLIDARRHIDREAGNPLANVVRMRGECTGKCRGQRAGCEQMCPPQGLARMRFSFFHRQVRVP